MTSQKTGGQEDFFRDTEMEKDDSSLNRGPDVDDQEREGKQAAEQGEAERQAFSEDREGDDACAEDGQDSQEKEKKGFFHKKEKKDPKDEKIEELTDRLMRTMAEFDNYRKRTDKEKSAMYEIGAKDIIEKMLPVVDNFERGMATLKEEEAHSPFAEGMDKIYKQLLTTLESLDVTVIEAVGQEFNPDFHNAVMHVEDEGVGENVVVEEFQKGYLYRGGVVRHSMVKVAN